VNRIALKIFCDSICVVALATDALLIIASNTTITISCLVNGVPTPAVTWLKDEVQIIEGDRFSITVDNSLVIKGAEVKENAKYTCSVKSAFGKDDSSFIVRIMC